MKLVRTLPIVFSLVALSTTAWAAQHDGHKPHHPAGSTAAGKVTPGSPEMTRMDTQMQALHDKMMAASDGRPYRILGACNPPLAHRALQAEPDIGLLLPCNAVVREDADGRLLVGFMDPVAVLQMTSNPEVAEVSHEVRQRLERVRSALLGATAVATATPTARVASNKSR